MTLRWMCGYAFMVLAGLAIGLATGDVHVVGAG